jgi:hypothetical protein
MLQIFKNHSCRQSVEIFSCFFRTFMLQDFFKLKLASRLASSKALTE